MKLRGRELYIIVGVVAVVVGVLWYFFLFSPEQKKVADLNTQYVRPAAARCSRRRCRSASSNCSKKTAPQAEADLIKLHQVMPSEAAIPSFIVGLTTTAQASGLALIGVTPEADGCRRAVLGAAHPARVRRRATSTSRTSSTGSRTTSPCATGSSSSPDACSRSSACRCRSKQHEGLPDLDVKVTINGYQWTPSGAATALAGAQ